MPATSCSCSGTTRPTRHDFRSAAVPRSGQRHAGGAKPMKKSTTTPQTMTVADAHALADRLERDHRLSGDGAMAVKLIRALLRGRGAGEVVETGERNG